MESSTDAEPMMELATMLIIDHSDTLELEIPSRPKSVEPTITDNDKPVDSIKMSITNPKKVGSFTLQLSESETNET